MSKMTFKRIALAVVAALGFGVLSVAPSSALVDETLTVGTPSATTVELNESVTATIDLSFVSETTVESRLVGISVSGAGAFTSYSLIPLTTDSANVGNHGNQLTGTAVSSSGFAYRVADARGGDTITATAANTYTRAKWTLALGKALTAGAINITVFTYNGSAGPSGALTGTSVTGGVLAKTANFSVTITAANTTGVASTSLMYLNETMTAGGEVTGVPVRNDGLAYLRSDSTLVMNAGVADSPKIVGFVFFEARNSADTRTATSGAAVTASPTINVTGPGLLALYTGGTIGTRAKSVSPATGDTIVVYSDGTAGTMTITGYIGGTALTQAAKTVTFVGVADSFVATADSATTGVLRGNTTTISFDALDSAGNKINGTNTQYRTGTTGYYLVVPDTTVVGPAFTSSNRGAGATTAYSSACTYNSVRAKWVCQVPTTDSGTVSSVYVTDSLTAATAVKKSAEITIVVSGAGYTGTISANKTTYNVGEEALFTLTCKDFGGRNIINGSGAACFTSPRWDGTAASTVNRTDAAAAGGSTANLVDYLGTGGTFVAGVDTVLVYMPTTAGTYKILGKTSGATTDSTLLTFTVTDPVQDAQNALIAAAQAAAVAASNAAKAEAAAATAAADAATDAALQAIDAANAATDAANLAAEAADAATVAAEEAKDAADAATAAVEALATQVATLMAALQAQIRSLANTVAKIAKKVKA